MGRGNILVVDDDGAVRESMCRLLAQQGYTVRSAENGADALERMRRDGAPDVVLLDMAMPVMSGYECARRIVEDPSLAKAAVIIWSAERPDLLGTVPARGYVPKPTNVAALLAMLERVLEESGERRTGSD